jgi:type 1 glutamine amidotransferase
MNSAIQAALLGATTFFVSAAPAAEPIRALVIDGQNNHAWQSTTPVLRKILDDTKLFQVDVLTAPARGENFSKFRPEFAKYRVVISNYNDVTYEPVSQVTCNGDKWPVDVKSSFEKYVRNGGGFVVYHAADNAFPDWPQYNVMIGIGGWCNRDEKAGPYWYYSDGKLVSDRSPGPGGSHGQRVAFQVTVRDPKHPITNALPKTWMHATDELYGRLRGPGENMTVLATAYSDPANPNVSGPFRLPGTGRDEPMLLVLSYGKGRVFHTALGHDVAAMASVDFIVTFQRGAEWAATGKVTVPVPADFPGPDKVSVR